MENLENESLGLLSSVEDKDNLVFTNLVLMTSLSFMLQGFCVSYDKETKTISVSEKDFSQSKTNET